MVPSREKGIPKLTSSPYLTPMAATTTISTRTTAVMILPCNSLTMVRECAEESKK